MDLKKIAENYPKAYGRQITWRALKSNPFGGERELFDFFDEYEIWVEVSATSINEWSYDIFKLTENTFTHIASSAYMYLSRTEAEEAAFEKAFEILEGRL